MAGIGQKVGSDVIARLFGVTPRRINQLTVEHVIAGDKVKGNYEYDMFPTIQRYIKYLSDKLAGKGDADKDAQETAREYNKAGADLKRARADTENIKLAELRGQMHRSEDVEALMSDFIMKVRSAFTSFPPRLAVDVSKAKSAAEANKIIKAETNRVLEELSEYQYDPAEFAERVKRREGAIQVADDPKDESAVSVMEG